MPSLYMRVKKEDIAEYVIFSGDPQRLEMLKKYLSEVKHIASSREFTTYTGKYKDLLVSITSTGIGSASAAIAMEEMYEAGMRVAVRMGTSMGLEDDLLGKFFIPIGMMRGEASSKTYVPESYPAVANVKLMQAMSAAALASKAGCDNGIGCTLDGFYSQMKESLFSRQMQIEHGLLFEELRRYGIKGVDMESSLMLTLGRLMNVKTCCVTMVTVLENLKQKLEGERRKSSEELLCKVVLDGIYRFHTDE